MLLWVSNLGFAGGEASIWSDASTNTALWYTQNPTATIWDGGATNWDSDGNVFSTLFDAKDTIWSCANNKENPSSWTDQTSGVATGIKSIWYDDQWVAVGDSGLILTSSDGVNWTQRTSGVTNNLRTVKKWHNRWYVCGHGIGTASAAILTSNDAVTWTSHDLGIDSSLVDIGFNDSTLLMVGWTSDATPDGLIVDTSGLDFNATVYAGDSYYYGVHWSGSLWGLVGNGHSTGASSEPLFSTSPDFTTWTSRTTGITGATYEHKEIWILDYYEDTWLIASGRGQVQTTTDLITFTDRIAGITTTAEEYPWRFTHNAAGVIMLCSGGITVGHIVKSIDKGQSWELSYSHPTDSYMRKAIFGCEWLAVGDSGKITAGRNTSWVDA